jgi:hypothetical protein
MFRAIPSAESLAGGGNSEQLVRETREQLAQSTPFSRAGELLVRMRDPQFDPYRIAYDRGMNVSTLLETLDPSGQHEGGTSLDAFERVLRYAGVRMSTDSSRGIFASRFQDLEEDVATKRLIPEIIARLYRSATCGGASENRSSPVFLSTDYVSNSLMRPFAQRPAPYRQPVISSIPIDSLVAITTGIDNDTYRGFYIDNVPESVKLKRVTEAAELPRTRIKGREQAVRLYKYGRAVEFSYEVMRRMAIDLVALIIQMMAAQSDADKVTEAIGVLVNGDGNSNAASVINLTTEDAAATPPNLTLKGWTNFQLEFENPYALQVVLVQKSVASQILLLNTGTANLPLAAFAQISGFGSVRTLNRTNDNIGLAWTSEAPASKIVGVDTTKALERVYEIGASISEVDRFITRQVEVLTLSESEGFAKIDKDAVKILNLAA